MNEIFVDFGLRVETQILIIAIDQLAGNNRAVMSRILCDLPKRSLQSFADDVDTAGLIIILALQTVQRL